MTFCWCILLRYTPLQTLVSKHHANQLPHGFTTYSKEMLHNSPRYLRPSRNWKIGGYPLMSGVTGSSMIKLFTYVTKLTKSNKTSPASPKCANLPNSISKQHDSTTTLGTCKDWQDDLSTPSLHNEDAGAASILTTLLLKTTSNRRGCLI